LGDDEDKREFLPVPCGWFRAAPLDQRPLKAPRSISDQVPQNQFT
jgi:hypothetical protein